MDATLKLWVVILAVGLLNYLSRLSFIAVFARRTMPPLLARALKYVPAAMLTALIVPMIAADPAAGHATAFNPRIAAAVIAGVVAFHTRSSLWTMGTGMAALWALQAVS
jgi:branched-subunit amino acid transport protein